MSWDILPKNRIQYIFEKLKTVIPVVKANPSDTATDNLTKIGIDGTNYNVTDADYRSNMHTFTTTGYDTSTHKFYGSEMSMSYAVKSIFSPLTTVYNALKTAINDHAGVFTTINTAISSLTTALSSKVDKDSVTFKDLTSSGHRFGIDLSIVSQFTGSNDVLHENTNLTAIKTVVNNLADYTEENVEIETLANTTPYLYRKSPAIGTRVMENALVGASVAWNQLVGNGNFANTGNWAYTSGATFSVSNNEATLTSTANGVCWIKHNIDMQLNHVYLSVCSMKASTARTLFMQVGNVSKTFVGSTSYKQYATILKPTSNSSGRVIVGGLYIDSLSGDVLNYKDYMCIDLTQMFGTTIADYAYTLEQATAGSGIAWLKSYDFFTEDYYAYDSGSLQSVKTSGKKVVGFNQWDEEWEIGAISNTTGQNITGNGIRSKNYIPIIGGNTYYITFSENYGNNCYVMSYDANKNFLNATYRNRGDSYDANSKVAFIRFYLWGGGKTYSTYYNDICINISKPTGSPKNGDYLPYDEHTCSISPIDLRGVPKLVNNAIVYDGDIYESSGNVTRKWSNIVTGSFFVLHNTSSAGYKTYVCSLVNPKTNSFLFENFGLKHVSSFDSSTVAEECMQPVVGTMVYIAISSSRDIADFRCQYELATPYTESLLPYTNPQKSFVGGTEEWITDNDVPVGHDSEYKKLPDIYSDDYMEYQFNNKDITDIQSYIDSKPYLYRRSIAIGDRVYDKKLIGASVVVNQLAGANARTVSNYGISVTWDSVNKKYSVTGTGNANTPLWVDNITLPANRKVLLINTNSNIKVYFNDSSINGQSVISASTNGTNYFGIYVEDGKAYSGTFTLMCIDLTQMFGTAIADYVYTLEQATAGIGIAWLKSYGFFTKDYYPANPGQIVSVMPTVKKYVGKNLFGGEYDALYHLFLKSGTVVVASAKTTDSARIQYFDKNQNLITWWILNSNQTSGRHEVSFALLRDAYYFKFTNANCVDMQIELGTTATPYEPYTAQSYPISADELRGVLQLVGDEIVWDGDVREPDGNTKRKYWFVTLDGSNDENWSQQTSDNNTRFACYNCLSLIPNENVTNHISNQLLIASGNNASNCYTYDNQFAIYAANYVYISGSFASSVEDLRSKLSSNPLVIIYQIATPTTEHLTPFASPQICYTEGTEEFIDNRDFPVPVGHESEYIKVPDWMAEEHVKDFRDRVESKPTNEGGSSSEIIEITPGDGQSSRTFTFSKTPKRVTVSYNSADSTPWLGHWDFIWGDDVTFGLANARGIPGTGATICRGNITYGSDGKSCTITGANAFQAWNLSTGNQGKMLVEY